MTDYYCPECRERWSGAYNCWHRCVTCGSPIKAREPWREEVEEEEVES